MCVFLVAYHDDNVNPTFVHNLANFSIVRLYSDFPLILAYRYAQYMMTNTTIWSTVTTYDIPHFTTVIPG